MHPKYKYAQSAFLALIGSHPIATGTDDKAVGEGISSAVAASSNPLGAECVPTSLKPNWNNKVVPLTRKKHTIKADVGILTPEWRPCPGLYELCEVDGTSLLGGRCTAFSRRVETISEEEQFQECKVKCPGNMICDCMYIHASDSECEWKTFNSASACRNQDHSRCLMSEFATTWEVFFCPFYYCIEGIDEEKNYEDAYDVCLTCAYKNACDYCKENDGSFSRCAEEYMYHFCKNAPIDKTYHYSQNCADSLESLGEIFSWDDNDDSKGGDNGDKDDGSGAGKSSDNGGTTDPVVDGNGEGIGVNKSDTSSFVENQEDNSSSGGKAVVGIAVATLAMVSMRIFNS